MPSAYLDRLLAERDELRTTATGLLDGAAAEQRSLSDAEQGTLADIQGRLGDLDARLEPLVAMEEREAAHLSRVSALDLARRGAAPQAETRQVEMRQVWSNAGAYVLDYAAAQRGDTQAQARLMAGTAEYRAALQQGTADNLAIIPAPLVGPLIDNLDRDRPTVAAFGTRPMPGPGVGQKWNRPKVTVGTLAGAQTTEFGDLVSRKMVFTNIEFTRKFYGGVLEVSKANATWTDPSILSTSIADLYRAWGRATNIAVATDFVTKVTQTVTQATDDYAGFVKAVFQAAATIKEGAGNTFPDTMWLAPDMWAKVGAFVSPEGRLLVGLDPRNYMGSPLNINVVVDSDLTAGTMIVGDAMMGEVYASPAEYGQVLNVDNFATKIGVIGELAFNLVEPAGFVKVTAAAAAAARTKA